MITIIRLKSQEKKERICDDIVFKINELQKSLEGKGHLLYLSKRIKHEDVSLFVHTTDPGVLGDFIADQLNKIGHITDIWVINLIKPIFYPLPKDTKNMKRYVVALKIFPKNLKDVYQHISKAILPEGLRMAYIAYTFHLFGDSLQFSVLTEEEKTLTDYLSDAIDKIPGVLKRTVNRIERTRPLVSYDTWKQYSLSHGLVTTWDEELMIEQFQN